MILNFSSVFFVIVQSAENPKIKKVIPNDSIIERYSIEKEEQGIDYITCILEGMRDTNSGMVIKTG